MENPKWPPLNPNLRLYVEVGNEIWNWGFGSTQDCRLRNEKEVKDHTPDGKIVSYDGQQIGGAGTPCARCGRATHFAG